MQYALHESLQNNLLPPLELSLLTVTWFRTLVLDFPRKYTQWLHGKRRVSDPTPTRITLRVYTGPEVSERVHGESWSRGEARGRGGDENVGSRTGTVPSGEVRKRGRWGVGVSRSTPGEGSFLRRYGIHKLPKDDLLIFLNLVLRTPVHVKLFRTSYNTVTYKPVTFSC